MKNTLLFVAIFGFSAAVAQPHIQSFSPVSGPVGTTVQINGSGFDPNPANNLVFFGAVKAVVESVGTTSLQVKVPVGASYQPILVTVAGKSVHSRLPFHITFPNGGNLSNNSLAEAVDYETDLKPNDLVLTDLDGDGLPDLATSNNYSSNGVPASVSVLRNASLNGELDFDPKIDLPTGVMAYALAAGDLDGDGKQDLITTSIADSKLAIFRNTGNPGSIRFASRQEWTTGDSPYDITVADFNGDGRMDLAVTNFFSNYISIYQNNSNPGSLSFTRIANLPTNEDLGPNSLSAADFDGDGKPDLAVTCQLSNTIAVFHNKSGSTISFGDKNRFFGGTEVTGLAVGDYNNDGRPDLIYTFNTPNATRVHLNTSTPGTLLFEATASTVFDLLLPKHPAVADLNGDGKIDVAISTYSNLRILQNGVAPASPLFSHYADYYGNSPYAIAIGDLNMDGFPEVVTTNFTAASVSVYKNQVLLPSVTGFDPAIGGEGTRVTITGNNFLQATAVQFGGVPAASYTIIDNNRIEAITGAGAGGPVQVTNEFGSGKLPGFTFTAPPVIEHFTPDVADSGVVVTINGVNFIEVQSVSFGGTPAVSFEVVSPTVIKAKPGLGSTGSITIVNAYGSGSKSGFRIGVPAISSFSPLSAGRKDTVVIRGTNFQNITQVYFGGSAAFSFEVVSPTEIRALVGGGNSGKISVRSVRLFSLDGFNFLLPAAPKVQSIEPASGIPGSVFTITGTNFHPNRAMNRVLLGQVEAEIIQATTTSIQAKVPTGAGIKPIEVTNLETGLQVQTNKRFTVTYSDATSFDSTLTGPTTHINEEEYEPVLVQLNDLNKDGKLDLLGGFNVTPILIRQNKSRVDSIAFSHMMTIPLPDAGGISLLSVRAADLDGDGWEDLISTNYKDFMEPGSVSLFSNNQNRDSISFTPGGKIDLDFNPNEVGILDIDGDGRLDFYVLNMSQTAHYKNTSAGPGHFQFERLEDKLPIGTPCDLNNDGLTDILQIDTWSVDYFRNTTTNGKPSFAAPERIYWGYYENYIYEISIGDLDGDGLEDIILSNSSQGKRSTTVLRNTGSAAGPGFTEIELASPGAYNSFGRLLDIDGNGKLDYILLDKDNRAVGLYQNLSTPGSIQFGPIVRNNNPFSNYYMAPGDIDGDGKMDLVLSDYSRYFDVLRNRMNEVSIQPSGALGICANGSLVLQSNIKTNNQWYKDGLLIPGATGQSFTVTQPGNYSAKALVNGLTYNSPRPVRVYTSTAPEQPVITMDLSNNLVSSSAEGNQWYLENVLIEGATERSFKPLLSGNYTVRVTKDGCSAASLPYYLIGTGVEEVDNNNETLAIYPNPVRSDLTIRFKQTGLHAGNVRVYNASGLEVFQQRGVVSGSKLNLSALPAGYYLLRLVHTQTNSVVATRRLLKF